MLFATTVARVSGRTDDGRRRGDCDHLTGVGGGCVAGGGSFYLRGAPAPCGAYVQDNHRRPLPRVPNSIIINIITYFIFVMEVSL